MGWKVTGRVKEHLASRRVTMRMMRARRLRPKAGPRSRPTINVGSFRGDGCDAGRLSGRLEADVRIFASPSPTLRRHIAHVADCLLNETAAVRSSESISTFEASGDARNSATPRGMRYSLRGGNAGAHVPGGGQAGARWDMGPTGAGWPRASLFRASRANRRRTPFLRDGCCIERSGTQTG